MDKELDWGRPYGRPFSPELLTLEEWLILYRLLPSPNSTNRDYIRVAVPCKLEAVSYDDDATCNTTRHMDVVGFQGRSYYGCSHEGMRGLLWHPEGASKEVLGYLRTAGMMNPLGDKY